MSIILKIFLLFSFLFLSAQLSADCMRNLNREVYCGAGRCAEDSNNTIWCSRHYNGDAVRMMNGRVACGVGECRTNSIGKVICSSKLGGTVISDSRGRIRCYGKCELASKSNCENTRADFSEH